MKQKVQAASSITAKIILLDDTGKEHRMTGFTEVIDTQHHRRYSRELFCAPPMKYTITVKDTVALVSKQII